MALSDLQVFNDWAYTAMTEVVAQQVQLFNESSRGGIILRAAANTGDYSDEAHWKKLAGLVRRRDAYGSGVVTALTLEQLLATSVKVAAGTPPVEIEPGMLKWIQRNPEEAGMVYGEQLAGDMLQDMLNVAIGSFVAGVSAIASINFDGTAATANLSSLNSTVAKFGDRSQAVLAWIMHSKSLTDIYGEALTNTNRLFEFGTVQVIEDGFGRPLIITDSPDLHFDNVGTENYRQLGIVSGSMVVEQNGDFTDNIETKNGDENILSTIQSEWSYNMGMKGLTWDKVNGGASPTDAELRTATNWDQTATDIKDGPGVMGTTL